MTKLVSLSTVAAVMLVSGSATTVTPGLTRVWVSGHGTDVGTCGAPTTPCRTLQYAHDNIVVASGEIDILDPAGYGPVVISKALSIVNDGVGTAGVQQANASLAAITINAGASDAIYLRGLNIDGLGTGEYGILFVSGASLAATNCVVRHFGGHGIVVGPSSGATRFSISNTTVSDNVGVGILVASDSGTSVIGTITAVEASHNGNGIVEEVSAGAGQGTSLVLVGDANVSNNFYGITVAAGANLALTHSIVAGNSYGVYFSSGGMVSSYGDNRILGNNTEVYGGTLTTVTGN